MFECDYEVNSKNEYPLLILFSIMDFFNLNNLRVL